MNDRLPDVPKPRAPERPRPLVGPFGRFIRLLFALVALTGLAFAAFRTELVPPLVIGFVALAGIFPATYVAYLGFAADAHRKRLEDDFLLLGLARREEVSETVSTLYDTIYSPGQFVIYVGLVVLVSLVMFWGFGRCMGGADACAPLLSDATMELVFFAYLGAYVFSVQELVRRYNTFDLQPQVYSSIAIRMLIAVAIVYVAAPVLQAEPAGPGGGDQPVWPMVVAFVIGVFPTQGLHFLSRIATRFLIPEPPQRRPLPLGNLLGISPWHESRLVQMGIDDAQNLATVDIRRLLLTTRFDTQQIVNWVDQAILYVRVGDRIERFREAQIGTFHELRCALDRARRTPAEGAEGDGAERRARLAATFGLSHVDALEGLGDAAGYPNYSHIAEFYQRSAQVARERAGFGMERLLAAPRVSA